MTYPAQAIIKDSTNNTANSIMPGLPCIAGDSILDPDSIYSNTTGLTMSTAAKDYAPLRLFRGIVVMGGASGQAAGLVINVVYQNGAVFPWTIPAIAAYDSWTPPYSGELAGIQKTGTTAILIYPFF